MKVLVLTGLPLSGKSALATYISEKFSIPYYETGPFVFKEVEKRGLEITAENIKKVAGECKAISDSYFTERAVEAMLAEHPDAPLFILTGIRALSEVNYLRSKFGEENVVLVGVHASVRTRYQRIFNKDRSGGETAGDDAKAAEDKRLQDFNEFVIRTQKELEYGVGSVLAMSDYLLNNDDQVWPFSNLNYNRHVLELLVRQLLES